MWATTSFDQLVSYQRRFCIMITAIASGNWENPAIWSTGTIPTLTDDVLIPSGISVTLTNGQARNVTLNGTLSATAVSAPASRRPRQPRRLFLRLQSQNRLCLLPRGDHNLRLYSTD